MTDRWRSRGRGYRIRGRVQGVGYRWWTRAVAEELGLDGSVRNLPDGSVEVCAYGAENLLDDLERRLAVGPRFASVRSVDTFEVGAPPRRGGFRIDG